MFEWSDLRHFLAVARAGSTLAAAKELGVNQSTVQRRLAALEASLGKPLVERHPTGYRLTHLGEEMLPFAERVEASIMDFRRHYASRDLDLVGTVRVECPSTTAHRLLKSSLVDMFHARHPGLRLEFVLFGRFLDLAKGEADLAIRHVAPQDKGLVRRKIADVPWAVFASRGYLERHGCPSRAEDIEHHAIIDFVGAIANLPAVPWMRSVAPRARIAARSDNLVAVLLAVKSGAGLAALPVPLAEAESDLVAVLGPLPELTHPFYLVIHRDMRHSPRVRAFCDFVTDEIRAFRMVLTGASNRLGAT